MKRLLFIITALLIPIGTSLGFESTIENESAFNEPRKVPHLSVVVKNILHKTEHPDLIETSHFFINDSEKMKPYIRGRDIRVMKQPYYLSVPKDFAQKNTSDVEKDIAEVILSFLATRKASQATFLRAALIAASIATPATAGFLLATKKLLPQNSWYRKPINVAGVAGLGIDSIFLATAIEGDIFRYLQKKYLRKISSKYFSK